MPRKNTNKKLDDEGIVDFSHFYDGISLLKFGRKGDPHEKIFTLTKDNRYIVWLANFWSWKWGAECECDLSRVRRIQLGQSTEQFERFDYIYGIAKDRSLSIIYLNENSEEVSLDLIAPNEFICNYVHRCVKRAILELEYERTHMSIEKRYLKVKWEEADEDRSGLLNRREIISIVGNMNIDRPRATLYHLFEQVDIDASGQLDFSEFTEFMDRIRRKPELEYIWSLLLSGQIDAILGAKGHIEIPEVFFNETKLPDNLQEFLTDKKFMQFWNYYQCEELSIDDIRAMIGRMNMVSDEQTYETDPDAFNKIGYYEWRNLITGIDNDCFNPEMSELYQDMSRPLSDYFISSSFNTYQMGDLITGTISSKRYVEDLLAGCRCVEVDVWDGDRGDPVVFHGNMGMDFLSKKLHFIDVIKAIKENAFVNSPFPVIIRLENHCGPQQQKKMAQILKNVLGDQIAMPLDLTNTKHLPSPHDLREMFLIEGKRVLTGEAYLKEMHEEHDRFTDMDDHGKKKILPNKQAETDPILSQIIFLASGSIETFSSDKSESLPADVTVSFSELKVSTSWKHTEIIGNWINHNRSHLTRIYPKSDRRDSSNYDPTIAWACGSQLAALNYQTHDIFHHVNAGKFRQNGNVGYVLKPESMLSTDIEHFTVPIRLTIHIISAQQLPKPGGKAKGEIIDPFIQIHLHGAHEDEKLRKTKVIDNNGFNPVFNEVFYFDIHNPDVSHITLVVLDSSSMDQTEFIAYVSMPINCIRPGFRSLSLYDEQGMRDGDFEFASLFVRTSIEGI